MDRRRLDYLQRLGVEVYIPRDAVIEEAETQSEADAVAGANASASASASASTSTAAASPVERQRQAAEVIEPQASTLQSSGVTAQGVDAAQRRVPAPAVDALGWAELEQAVGACRGCKLCEDRTQTVFGVGDQQADLVLVGEGPGAEEDRLGEPFVGRAGKLLDAMLAAIDRGRERGGVYICNIVKCRPPGNREPRPDEVAACSGYLRRQLELLEPKLIVALGRVAAQKLLDSSAPLGKLRGQSHTYADTGIPVWVTYHPAYLLRSPVEKAKSWQDLKRIRAAL